MKRNFIIFMLCTLIFTNSNVYIYGKTNSPIDELKKKQQTIENNQRETKKKIESAKNQLNSISDELSTLDTQIVLVKAEVDNIDRELETVNKDLNKSSVKLMEAQKKEDVQFETMKKRIRSMYINKSSSYLEVLFDSENLMDLLRKYEYINRIIEYDQNVLKNYNETKTAILNETNIIELKKSKASQLKTQIITKKNSLEEKIKQKTIFLAQIESDKLLYEKQLAELETSDKEIETLIKKAEQKKSTYSTTAVVIAPNGKFQWPTPGYYPSSSSFGSRKSPISGKSEFHTGLDIPAPYGTNVLASESGSVIKSGVIRGYGNVVIIDHGNGITTLYAHNSKLLVSVGDSIAKGQAIAKVGSTGYSTGNHCHIEVRINGKATNPMNYLQK